MEPFGPCYARSAVPQGLQTHGGACWSDGILVRRFVRLESLKRCHASLAGCSASGCGCRRKHAHAGKRDAIRAEYLQEPGFEQHAVSRVGVNGRRHRAGTAVDVDHGSCREVRSRGDCSPRKCCLFLSNDMMQACNNPPHQLHSQHMQLHMSHAASITCRLCVLAAPLYNAERQL